LSSPVRVRANNAPIKGKRKRGDGVEETKNRRRESGKVPRTREYEVVGVIRKKVVFALRWGDTSHTGAKPPSLMNPIFQTRTDRPCHHFARMIHAYVYVQ
jgi:hypothetical protein